MDACPEATVADLFRALAHPVRLRLIQELSGGEECVCHLASVLGRPQPYVSQQLSALREAGLVEDRRDGQRVFYRLSNPVVPEVVSCATRAVGELPGLWPEGERGAALGCPCPKCCGAADARR